MYYLEGVPEPRLWVGRTDGRIEPPSGEGGFVLTDFKPDQFMRGAEGDVWLVDGPAPNDGPLMDYLIARFGPEDPLLTSGLTSAKGTKVLDFRPGRPQTCANASFEKPRSAT